MPSQIYAHEEVKKRIIANPAILGLENIVDYKEEVPFSNGRRKLGQIDIIFWDSIGTIYIVEITTGKCIKTRKRVKRQAEFAKNFFKYARALSVICEDDKLEITWH